VAVGVVVALSVVVVSSVGVQVVTSLVCLRVALA
jgi:hypothetical protein